MNDIKINFEKMNGLIPVVIQDAIHNDVLMLGFMNEEAYSRTMETKIVWFYSRTKKRLWKKGEESGNTLTVQEVRIDCDADSILMKVRVNGTHVCHTGNRSCFYTKI